MSTVELSPVAHAGIRRRTNQQVIRYGFLPVPDFTLVAFANAIEPLRMANRISGQLLYTHPVFTLDGRSALASNGLTVGPSSKIDAAPMHLDALFVCAGTRFDSSWSDTLTQELHQLRRKKIPIGGICTGSYLLAQAGMLDGYRCTVHWENIGDMRDEFPELIISSELFELDRDRFTCSGGTAPMDMMLTLIGREHGAPLANAISEQFICERIRGQHDRQRIPLRHQFGANQPKLVEAVELMEANIEEPMSLDELSGHVGISRRQLERIFQKHMQCVPTRYYLELRLRRARALLLNSSKTVVDIAFSCGFVSAPHFSKCYRDCFGVPPRDERRRLLQTKPTVDAPIEQIAKTA